MVSYWNDVGECCYDGGIEIGMKLGSSIKVTSIGKFQPEFLDAKPIRAMVI